MVTELSEILSAILLGIPNPTAYGVCWNATGTPTTHDSKVDKGSASATGAFTTSMTGLIPETNYYVRAFATNSSGTSYGDEVIFKTNPTLPAPTSVTATPSIIILGGSSLLKATSTSQYIQWWDAATGGNRLNITNSGADYTVTPNVSTTYYAQSINKETSVLSGP